MAKNLDEQILKEYPLDDFDTDRAAFGSMALVQVVRERTLTEGVLFRECLYRRGDGKDVWVYLTRIDPDAKAQLAVSAAPLRTAKFVKNHAKDFENFFGIPVFYAMNASFFHFFNDGDLTPYGIQVVGGVELALPANRDLDKPWYNHNFLAVDKEGKAFICNSEEYYSHWQGKLAYAVGGGMRLMREGKITLHHNHKPLFAPRTAVAIAEDGTVFLLCADGRSTRSAGLSYGDMVDIFLQQGTALREILNLDGGGSTTVVLRDEDGTHRVENVPSGPPLPVSYARYGIDLPEPSGEAMARPVADTVLVIAKP